MIEIKDYTALTGMIRGAFLLIVSLVGLLVPSAKWVFVVGLVVGSLWVYVGYQDYKVTGKLLTLRVDTDEEK